MRTGIAIGSNVGDRLQRLREAQRELLVISEKNAPFLASRIYETEPVDCESDAQPFLNAVVEIEFAGEPASLLAELRAIENRFGRPSRRPRNAPRTIDLDILYFGNLSLTTDSLIIPHPRIAQRRFVLAPLNDIRVDLILPDQKISISELLAKLPENPSAKPLNEPLCVVGIR